MSIKKILLDVYKIYNYGFRRLIEKIKYRDTIDFLSLEPNEELYDGCIKYEPSHLSMKFKCFDKIAISRDDALLDVGCGKGKAMAFFYEMGFKKVDGIEISSKMSEIARRNLSALGYSSKIYNTDPVLFTE